MKISVVILAAGQGTRMHSAFPKVLHPIGGCAMLEHVIAASFKTLNLQQDTAYDSPHAVKIIVGYGAEKVRKAFSHYPVSWVVQQEQRGTGDAVKQALPLCTDADVILVLYGDVPLIRSQTLKKLIHLSAGKHLSLLSAELNDPTGYGRIIRNEKDEVINITEEKDTSQREKNIREINTGVMVIPQKYSQKWLDALNNHNTQQEYYLTDIIAMAVADGVPVVCTHPEDIAEIQGVNNCQQLAIVEREYQRLQAEHLMQHGVTITDPARVDIRGNLVTGKDVRIDINCIFEGNVKLGNNVSVGAGSVIRNASIDDDTLIAPYSLIDESKIGTSCHIGPFARLRPGSLISNSARVGNFVETKKSAVGERTKIGHLSYVGDANIGADVNIGAGTITCNYDGANKYETTIKDHAFIGSNTALVAPVTVGQYAVTGAGSTITENVDNEQLAVARARQQNIIGWRKPEKEE